MDHPLADDLRIRRYDPADEDAVWDLHVRALDDAGAYDEEFSHLDADLRAIGTEFLEADGEFLVGELAETIVAMGAFQPHPDEEHTVRIRRMRIDPDLQGRGYGTAILAELERRARDRGFERAVLDTTPRQEAAMAFYPARGYEEIRRETVRGHEIVWFEKRFKGPSDR